MYALEGFVQEIYNSPTPSGSEVWESAGGDDTFSLSLSGGGGGGSGASSLRNVLGGARHDGAGSCSVRLSSDGWARGDDTGTKTLLLGGALAGGVAAAHGFADKVETLRGAARTMLGVGSAAGTGLGVARREVGELGLRALPPHSAVPHAGSSSRPRSSPAGVPAGDADADTTSRLLSSFAAPE